MVVAGLRPGYPDAKRTAMPRVIEIARTKPGDDPQERLMATKQPQLTEARYPFDFARESSHGRQKHRKDFPVRRTPALRADGRNSFIQADYFCPSPFARRTE
jgi:hypothetical protein